ELARIAKDSQVLFTAISDVAHVQCETDNLEQASRLADEYLAELRKGRNMGWAVVALHKLAWTLRALGRGHELVDALPRSDLPWVRAASALAAGDIAHAADICGLMGAVTEEARDRLWLAVALSGHDRQAEAQAQLQRALRFYRSVEATRYV